MQRLPADDNHRPSGLISHQLVELVNSGVPFPTYGVSTWTGTKVLSAASTESDRLTTVELTHLPEGVSFYDVDAPRLVVINREAPRPRETPSSKSVSAQLHTTLRQYLDREPFPRDAGKDERLRWLQQPQLAFADDELADVEIFANVQAQKHTIPGLVLDSVWLAFVQTELTSLTVLGDRIESSTLREPGLDTVDPSRYLWTDAS